MQTVHFSTSTTMTRTGHSTETLYPLGMSDAERQRRVSEYLGETKRNAWPVVLQVWETYLPCHKTSTSDHCGHCNAGKPTTKISNAAWHDGNGSARPRVVRQELFERP